MLNKNIMMIAIFLVSLLAISAVSASDNATSDVVSVEEDQVMEQTEIEEMADADDGTFTALENKINNTAEGSTITLENNYTYDDGFSAEGIEIFKSLTIDGNGYTIDAKNSGRIFKITSKNSNIILKNMILINGYSNRGAAVYLSGASYGSAVNCTFINNAAMDGGAMYGGLAVNCTFINNTAMGEGGARSYGNAVNCTFINNSAIFADYLLTGAMNWGDAINCTFINNSAEKYDASASCHGTGINCTYINNDVSTKFKVNSISTVYGKNDYLIITLKNNKSAGLSYAPVSVKFNGGTKNLYTDDNGQVKVSTKGLAPNTYPVTITFAGDYNFKKSSATTKITVKKATPKLTAAKKTFKKSVKRKQYSVTLKDNNNKVMKNIRITLKVNKKTYKVNTNAKGQATFKITNLKKKGTYTAVVKYAGSSYYNAKTAKPKITVK